MLARQTPGGESRPVPIGSRLIGVSLRPAIPRRVAPQQSPPPLHQSATIVAEPATPIKCEARPHRCHLGCHLYFARRVTFLSCADSLAPLGLIGFGIEMPMSLTILGVFGGFIGFGFLGLFIGATLIAIMFTLV